MVHVVVIGGGFAGLKAAVDLADAGVRVTVAEARTGLGGRARSFTDPATSEVVDNGQHLFLAGYQETLRFLERLGTRHRLLFQESFEVSFVEPGRPVRRLRSFRAAAPWHLILGLAWFPGLSLRDKFALGAVAKAVAASPANGCDTLSAGEWLARLGISAQGRRNFWNPLVVATLNEEPDRVSAAALFYMLKTLLWAPWPQARLGMACVGLTDLYATAAGRIVEEKGGVVLTNRPVTGLAVENGEIAGVRFADGQTLDAHAVISAVPPSALARILPDLPAASRLRDLLQKFTYAPILSVNLWLDRPVSRERFVGMIGTRFQWFFNKPALFAPAGLEAGYVSLILSAAHDFIQRSNDHLVRMAMEDLRACFPGAVLARLVRSQVVREREATVSLSVGMDRLRPGSATSLSRLFLAGDWTATQLPATIESAVVSGKLAAEAALK